MTRRFYKHKILLDENTAPRHRFPRLNSHFDVKHVRDDLKRAGASDAEVYLLASSLERLVVTANGRHFRTLVNEHGAGVVDYPAEWPDAHLDTKLSALLMKHGPAYFAGRYRALATEQPDWNK